MSFGEANLTCREAVERIVGAKRMAMTFRHIVTKTIDVSIGPLEYCG